MAINSIGFNDSLFGQAVLNLNNQLTNLSTQLATGEKSTTYSGMGVNEGFAIAARSAAFQHLGVHDHDHQRQHQHQRRQYRVAVAVEHRHHGAERCGLDAAGPSTAPARPSGSRTR